MRRQPLSVKDLAINGRTLKLVLRSTQERVDPLTRLAKDERAGPELGHGQKRGKNNDKKVVVNIDCKTETVLVRKKKSLFLKV